MIRYITRDTLDIEKYDKCIANAVNSRVYAYSWYLDIVADAKWDVLVLDDYKAVMPLPKRRKYFVKYVYTPFWVLQLGIFYNSEVNKLNVSEWFIQKLRRLFLHVNLRLNTGNTLSRSTHIMYSHQLNLSRSYNDIQFAYKSDRKKDIKKAYKYNLQIKETHNFTPLINLYKANVGQRVNYIKEKDYRRLSILIQECIERNHGEIIHVVDANNSLVAAAFILKNKNRITILISSTDFKNRNNGANTFLIDTVLKKYSSSNFIFDFGGSSIASIGAYFESFGAEKETYYQYKNILYSNFL